MAKDKKQAEKPADKKVFNKAEILDKCKKLETREVEIPGWGACVRMKNLTFQELLQIRIDSGTDSEARNAMIVAGACEDLDITDAYKLQSGNGSQFAALYAAVDDFLGCKLDAEKIKN